MIDSAEPFLRHIRACDNAVLPGTRVRLRIGAAQVGWVLPHHAPIRLLPDRAGFDRYVDELRQAKAFRERAEPFDVRDEESGTVVATVDRGALPLLGIRAEGVHVNGLVHRPEGIHVWVGRRAANKRLDPDKLDHLTAGGIAAGHDAWSTLLKEAGEEASLGPEIAGAAVLVSQISYAMERPEGLRRDLLHCFDLVLPGHVIPRPNDDEMAAFALEPLTAVAREVAETDNFKFNVNLVLIDLLLRHGLIDRGSDSGRRIDHAMQTLRHDRSGR